MSCFCALGPHIKKCWSLLLYFRLQVVSVFLFYLTSRVGRNSCNNQLREVRLAAYVTQKCQSGQVLNQRKSRQNNEPTERFQTYIKPQIHKKNSIILWHNFYLCLCVCTYAHERLQDLYVKTDLIAGNACFTLSYKERRGLFQFFCIRGFVLIFIHVNVSCQVANPVETQSACNLKIVVCESATEIEDQPPRHA